MSILSVIEALYEDEPTRCSSRLRQDRSPRRGADCPDASSSKRQIQPLLEAQFINLQALVRECQMLGQGGAEHLSRDAKQLAAKNSTTAEALFAVVVDRRYWAKCAIQLWTFWLVVIQTYPVARRLSEDLSAGGPSPASLRVQNAGLTCA